MFLTAIACLPVQGREEGADCKRKNACSKVMGRSQEIMAVARSMFKMSDQRKNNFSETFSSLSLCDARQKE